MTVPTENQPPVFTGPELCRLDAIDVVKMLKKKEVSPREVLEASFQRIQQVESQINAIPTLCEERAHKAMEAFTASEHSNTSEAGWLAGLPIAIKDLTPVSGVIMTMGTPGMKDYVPEESDALVELLESRGGIVVGKSNTPEMGAGGNTFNEVLGRTRNPWNITRNAGGSSGGAAASLAAGEVWLSHGSDLAGSLRTPAAYCGIVGLRPTPGRAGGAPADLSFNTEGLQGPMARTVLDTALFLDAMSGFDPMSPISLEAPAESFQSAVLQAEAKGVRISYSPTLNGFAPVEKEIDQVLRKALLAVESVGVSVDEGCPDLPELDRTYRTLRAMMWAALPGRLPEEVQAQYKKTLAQNINEGRQLTIDDVYDAQRSRAVLNRNMMNFLGTFDVLACPVVGLEPGLAEEEFPTMVAGEPVTDYIDWLRFSYLSTCSSLPAISIPVGFTQSGMPVGLQLIGPQRGEAKLLAVARIVEQAVGYAGIKPIDPITPVKAPT